MWTRTAALSPKKSLTISAKAVAGHFFQQRTGVERRSIIDRLARLELRFYFPEHDLI
jgi:hypothetical protein